MATRKQLAALKKANAARKRKAAGGNPTKRRRAPARRAPARRRPGNPRGGVVGKPIKQLGKIAQQGANAAMAYGIANVAITPLLGRNLMHPAGGLQSNPALRSPNAVPTPPTGLPGATPLTMPMVDIVGLAIGTVNPASIGGQFSPTGSTPGRGRAMLAGLNYNARAMFGNGAMTTWAPLGVGLVSQVAVGIAVPALNGLARQADRLVKTSGRAFA